jgi:hypothetical protein
MQKKIKTAVLISFFVLVVSAAFLNMYVVRDYGGATLISKDDEAILYVGTAHIGYRFSYLEYPLILIRQYFHAPPLPRAKSAFSTLIRITPSAIEQHTANTGDDPGRNIAYLTPFEEGFYAMCNGDSLCKWTANGFKPVTEEEKNKFGGIGHLVRGDINNKTINGWSVRQLHQSSGNHFEVSVGGKFSISAKNDAATDRDFPKLSIILVRPGQAPESLYSVDGRPRQISAREYRSIFSNH